MPPKRALVLSDVSSSSSPESSSDYSSSETSATDSETDEKEEKDSPDVRDKYLPSYLQQKTPKVFVSDFSKKKLRDPFLGTLLSKDERSEYTDRYYCSSEDFKLFSAGKTSSSPLALLKSNGSNAMKVVYCLIVCPSYL